MLVVSMMTVMICGPATITTASGSTFSRSVIVPLESTTLLIVLRRQWPHWSGPTSSGQDENTGCDAHTSPCSWAEIGQAPGGRLTVHS